MLICSEKMQNFRTFTVTATVNVLRIKKKTKTNNTKSQNTVHCMAWNTPSSF